MPPRNFYGLPPSWNPGFEIPDYVMAEPPGMGTFTTAWLPRGTISQMIPDFAAVDVGKEILGRANAGLGSLGDDTLGVSKSTRARDPIGNYGKVAASWLMRSIKSVPADQRVAALRAIFDAVDPSLWAAVDARAKTLRAAGGSAARALEDAIAISLSAGMLREVVEQGKRARRGQRPATSGHLALGSDRRAVPRAQVYALEALGFSLSDLNPIPHIVDAARATGRGIKTAATATAGFVKNGIKTLGSLACDVVSSGAGAAAATLAAGPAGAAGASAASGICSPKATLAVPPALPMYQPPAPKKSWLVPAVMVAGAVGVGAVIIRGSAKPVARFHRIHGQQDNIRQMLSAAGVGDFNATMSLPYMYFLPRACDPFTQGVIQIVEGLQNLLNQKGARLVVNGWMGPETVKALRRYAGNGYRDKTWLQLYGDVMNGKIAPDHAKRERALAAQPTPAKAPASALAGLVDDSTMNPIAWLAAGGAAYYFLRGSRAHR